MVGFGQVQRILVITIPPYITQKSSNTDYILIITRRCNIQRVPGIIERYATDGGFGSTDVISPIRVFGVAGRVVDRKFETFVERPGAHSYLHFDVEDVVRAPEYE
jgi:hypothetical protein